ncbi:RHS repeat-associated core domain-containing protein [Nocardiopsis kunsanensis]|uniref:RHS repeat-associated core domain-containing protein n=1 Tax=Nocardiopsis kunsanensis TaxID=141693 RepID=UPI001E40FCF3|nr:RHS repeat-associated core domain-containing protein [Nocardiopsis kunsanensis]
MRENDGSLSWSFSDQHNTGQIAVDAHGGEVVQRWMTVFGQDRGTEGVWPGERGFVDGTVDESTGLTQLGERAYDADLGRFVSVDPLMDLADAQTMNGYAYSNNSPATFGDPTGLSWHPARGHAPMPDYGSLPSPHPARGYAPMPNYGSLPSPHPARGFAPPTPNVQRAFNASIDTPSSSPTRSYTSHTVSSQESALNESTHQEEAGGGGQDPGFWERSGEWINENWDAIGAFGSVIGAAACVVASFGICLSAGAAVAVGKFGLDSYQNYHTDRDMRWAEHGMGLVGIGASGAFSGWLNGAMRYGQTSRGMREYVSFRRVKDEYWSTAVQTHRNGSFDAAGTGTNMGFNALSAGGSEAIGGTSDWLPRRK